MGTGFDLYDNWKTSPPEPSVVGKCALGDCGGEIYAGELAYVIGEDTLVHEDCFPAYAKEELNASLQHVHPREEEKDYDY